MIHSLTTAHNTSFHYCSQHILSILLIIHPFTTALNISHRYPHNMSSQYCLYHLLSILLIPSPLTQGGEAALAVGSDQDPDKIGWENISRHVDT